jgi:hypothetical protein
MCFASGSPVQVR